MCIEYKHQQVLLFTMFLMVFFMMSQTIRSPETMTVTVCDSLTYATGKNYMS